MRSQLTRTALPAMGLAGLALVSCAPEPRDPSGADPDAVLVQDSAGVRIVESLSPAWRTGEAWTVAPEADAILAGAGATDFALFGVVDLALLPDGAVAVANQGTGEVAVLDPQGGLRRRYGRRGEGPGEFRYLNGVLTRGDSVVAVDGASRRLSIFAPDGTLAREFSVPDETGRPTGIRAVGMGSSGVGVFREVGFAEKPPTGATRLPGATLRFAWDGTPAAELPGDFPGGAIFVIGATMGTLPLGPDLWMAGSAEALIVGDGERPDVRLYRPDGTLEARIRWHAPPRPVDPSMRDEWRAGQRAALEESLAQAPPGARAQALEKLEAFHEDIPFPAHLPVHTDLLFDDTGHLWVRTYGSPAPSEGPVSWQGKRTDQDAAPGETSDLWWIFDPGGRWLGAVSTPPGLWVKRVTRDAVWGVHRDLLGIETVRRHALSR